MAQPVEVRDGIKEIMGFSGPLAVWRWVAMGKWGEEVVSFQFPVFREEGLEERSGAGRVTDPFAFFQVRVSVAASMPCP